MKKLYECNRYRLGHPTTLFIARNQQKQQFQLTKPLETKNFKSIKNTGLQIFAL